MNLIDHSPVPKNMANLSTAGFKADRTVLDSIHEEDVH